MLYNIDEECIDKIRNTTGHRENTWEEKNKNTEGMD